MKTSMTAVVLCGALAAMGSLSGCTQCPPGASMCNSGVGGGGAAGGAGGGGGTQLALYDIYTIDTAVSDRYFMEMTVDKTRQRVAFAYVAGQGEVVGTYTDAGIVVDAGGADPDGGRYEVRYAEWENGTVKPPQTVDRVRRMVGLTIDLHPTTGEPAIAYLGGGADMSLYWFNSDAKLSYRTGGSTWQSDIAATNGAQVMCNNPVSDNPASDVVGMWAAIKYTSAGTLWFCYRDVHTGQYPIADWGASDVECVNGSPGNWTRTCAFAGGDNKIGAGGRTRMVMVNDLPVILWDQVEGGADTRGNNIWVQRRTANAWSAAEGVFSVGNTQQGGSIDYDSMEGLGVAAIDLAQGTLFYTNKAPTASMWSAADPVVGNGTGGWYPSLAMDKINHEPAIAYYFCSSVGNAIQCRPNEDEVRVTQRVNGDWAGHTEVVDTVTVTVLKLAFLPDGRKAVAYRERNGTLKLAVRKVP